MSTLRERIRRVIHVQREEAAVVDASVTDQEKQRRELQRLNEETAKTASKNSGWNIQPKAMEYAEPNLMISSNNVDMQEKILIVQEPHDDVRAQLNLFDFLHRLVDDNPGVTKKTVFLAEGTPRNEEISMEALNQAAPSPTLGMIEEVLESHTITGYTAYEWEQQKGIRIVGTEDPKLYALGAELSAKRASGQATEKDDKTWELTVMARNKSMVQSVQDKLKFGLKPILFVGGAHVDHEPKDEVEREENKAHIASLPEREAALLSDAELKSIKTQLEEKGVGFQYIAMKGHQDSRNPDGKKDKDHYDKTFVQQVKRDK